MSFYPISAFFGDVDRETAIVYGWEKIIRDVEKEKIELIYNGVKNLNFKKINKDHTTIICVANFIYYKRHLDILTEHKHTSHATSQQVAPEIESVPPPQLLGPRCRQLRR